MQQQVGFWPVFSLSWVCYLKILSQVYLIPTLGGMGLINGFQLHFWPNECCTELFLTIQRRVLQITLPIHFELLQFECIPEMNRNELSICLPKLTNNSITHFHCSDFNFHDSSYTHSSNIISHICNSIQNGCGDKPLSPTTFHLKPSDHHHLNYPQHFYCSIVT